MKSTQRFASGVFALALSVASGCVSDEPRRPEIPAQAANARPSTLQVVAGNPRDGNGNGYIDTVSVTAFLWEEQRSPIPLAVAGSFVFVLSRSDGTQLARWEFDEIRAAAAQVRMPAGPAYVFELSLLLQASDKVDAQQVELSATFAPRIGDPVKSAAGTGLRFGKTGA
jgi:hypothetical protein